METILNFFKEYTDVTYLFTFMFLSYLVATYFGNLFKMKTVFVVLIIATAVAVPYLLIGTSTWQQVVLSYAIGTSLHETCFKWIGKLASGLYLWLENKITESIK